MINRTLDNRYTILERIGGGGMADVYRAHDELLDRSVAVKVLKAQFIDDEGFVANFRREALAAAKLSHPNIVNIYDVGFENDIYYIIMEYISGETLKEKIDRDAPLSAQEAVGVGLEIAEALEHAHQNNIVHCDVKPHNILITRSGRVKVTDFGIARAVTSNTVSNAETILGSVHYFSPEQAQGTTVSAKSDIYSLGIVLYEMLTALLPFSGDSPIGIALKHIQESPVPLREVNPAILPLIEALVLKAMAKEPRQRFENIGEMIADLKMARNYLRDDSARRPFGADNDFSAQTLPQARIHKKDDKDSLPDYTLQQSQSSNPLKNTAGNVSPMAGRTKKWVITGLLFLLLVSAAAAFIGFGNLGALKEVTVPDVTGKQIDAAREILAGSALTVSITDTYDNNVLPGYVVSQQPEAGITVKEGRVIALIVSKGGEMVHVPVLTGLTRHNAEVQISNSALTLGKVDEQYSDDIQKDFIISQNPRPPAQIAKGSAVDIIISKGSLPKKMILPDFQGLPITAIVISLENLKLKLGPVTETETNDFRPGTVISQTPPPGSEIEEGASVGFLTAKAASGNTGNTGSTGTVKRAAVQAVIPAASGSKSQTLKIIVTDAKGRRVVYEEPHSPGEKVEKTVEGVGQVRVQVYVNNRLLQEQML